MKKCAYSIEVNGTTHEFDSEFELDNYILNNKNSLSYNNISDIVFSTKSNRQSEIYSILNSKLEEVKEITKFRLNYTTGDLDPEGYGSYIGVTSAITEFKNPLPGEQTKNLVAKFDKEKYRDRQVRKLINEGMPIDEASLQVDNMIKTWDVMAEMGTGMHKIAEIYFKNNGNLTDESLAEIRGTNPDISEEVLSDYISQLKTIKDELINAHGEGSIFISEYKITNPDAALIGVIDLLVIDPEGQVHLYDFKTSHKSSEEWQAVKELTYDYQLAFYRHMLAAYGIPVEKANLGIIPINLVNSNYESKTFESVKIEGIQDRLKREDRRASRLEWGLGRVYQIVNHYIPVKASENTVSSDFITELNSDLNKFFPNYEFKIAKEYKNKAAFIDKCKNRMSDGRYYFYDEFLRDRRYFENLDDLIAGVDVYFKSLNSNLVKESETLVNNLNKVINGKMDLNEISDPKEHNQYIFQNIIKQYINGNYKVLNIPELSTLGIIALQNLDSNYIDFLGLTSNYLQITNEFKLSSKITGNFEKGRSYLNNPLMLDATNGNIEIMKIMAAINKIPDLFNGGNLKVGKITIANKFQSQALSAFTNQLNYTFNRLTNLSGVKNNFTTTDNKTPILFASTLELLIDSINGAISSNSESTSYNKIKTLFEKRTGDTGVTIQALENFRSALFSEFPQLTKTDPGKNPYAPEMRVLYYLNMLINDLNNVNLSQTDRDISRYGILTGAYINNPDTQQDSNLRLISTIVNQGNQNVRDSYLTWQQGWRKVIQEFKDESNYGIGQETILGFQNYLYYNLFETNEDGTLNSEFLFKKENHSSLNAHENKLLKKVLWEINSRRFNIKSYDDPRIYDLQNTLEWYQIPLMKASGQTQVQSRVLEKKSLSTMFSRFTNVIKNSKKYLARAADNVISEQERENMNSARELFEMYDRFEMGEASRQALLDEHPMDYFEKNVEDIVSSYVFSKVRKEEMDKVLPEVQGILMMVRMNAAQQGIDISTYDKYINDFMKSTVFNMSIIEDNQKHLFEVIKAVKAMNSKLTLGFNSRTGIREIVQGLWKNIGASMIRHYGKEQFGTKEYTQALGIILGDSKYFIKDVTMIETINGKYGMANMDINAMVDRFTSNKKGMAALGSRWMFWTAGCPDYLNRMSVFIAQMIKDGCWDAHSMQNGELVYDWTKDERFSVYAKGLKTHSEYKNQEGRYLKMIDQFNREKKTNLKPGDALPAAYTSQERDSLKSFANMMYGYYDHEDKSLINHVFFGAMWLQFKTYMSSIKNKYLLKGGEYQQGKYVHKKDENGNLLYQIITETPEGREIQITTDGSNPNAVPVWDWQGRYMEGIFMSILHGVKEVNEFGWKESWARLSEEEKYVRLKNFQMFAYDMLMWSIWSILMAMLIKQFTKERNKARRQEDVDLITRAQDDVVDIINSSLLGSVNDFFVWQVASETIFNLQPPAFTAAKKMASDLGSVLTGDKNVFKAAVDNVGFLRQGRGFFYMSIDEVMGEDKK